MKEIPWTQGQPTEACRFFVFRFRTKPPHWAAKDGWLAGVAGPYWENEEPDLVPAGVFSRFEAFSNRLAAMDPKIQSAFAAKLLQEEPSISPVFAATGP